MLKIIMFVLLLVVIWLWGAFMLLAISMILGLLPNPNRKWTDISRSRPTAEKKKKVIIGLVGEKGCGKGTFKDLLAEMVPDKKIAHVRFSDVLAETLKLWGIPASRESLQKLSPAMVQAYGEGVLTRAVRKRVEDLDADIVILDGVRWLSDEEMLRQLPDNLLVYITADAKTRYERTKSRKEKTGEENTTLEQFMKEEQAETEKSIPLIGARADYKIINSGSLEELRTEIEKFCVIHKLI